MIANSFKIITIDNYNIKRSYISHREHTLEYPLNIRVVPRIGKIFVFKTLNEAREFAVRIQWKMEIYECFSENLQPFNRKYLADNSQDYLLYWNNHPEFLRLEKPKLQLPAKSTYSIYVADAITLLRQT